MHTLKREEGDTYYVTMSSFKHRWGTCTMAIAYTHSCRCIRRGSCGQHAFQRCHHAEQNYKGSAWQSAIPGCGSQLTKWIFGLRVGLLGIHMGLYISLKSFQPSSTTRQSNSHIFSEFTNSNGKMEFIWPIWGLAGWSSNCKIFPVFLIFIHCRPFSQPSHMESPRQQTSISFIKNKDVKSFHILCQWSHVVHDPYSAYSGLGKINA